MQDLIDYGEVIRGWLGVRVEPLRKVGTQNSSEQALRVEAVSSGSPAEKAGIQLGDIITHIDNEVVLDGRQVMHRMAMLRPGDRVAITIQRNQQSIDLQAVVGTLQQSQVRP